jgi:hypothetical protein
MKQLKFCLLFSAIVFSSFCIRAQNPDSSTAKQPGASSLPPGISFPSSGASYVLDKRDGGSELLQLHASEVALNSRAAGNFARSAVYVGARASVEVNGLTSSVVIQDRSAPIFVKINSDDPELMRARVHLIRMDQTKNRRVVLVYSQNIFGGQRAKNYHDIAITKTDELVDVWLKVTPQAALEPGEYAIVIMPKDANMSPDYVYDFSIANGMSKAKK